MTKFFFATEQNRNGKITGLSARRNDGKIYKVKCRNNGKWEILEYRGRDGVFNAVLNDPCLMWVSIEPFDSMIQACRWLKENIDNLLQNQ